MLSPSLVGRSQYHSAIHVSVLPPMVFVKCGATASGRPKEASKPYRQKNRSSEDDTTCVSRADAAITWP